MFTSFSFLVIGFTVFSALILFCANAFFLKNVNKSWYANASCAALLGSLVRLQLGHLEYFLHGTDVIEQQSYRFFLFLAPPMFFFFARATLLPDQKWHPLLLLHLIPVALNFLFRYEIAVPLIFMMGMIYCISFARYVYRLRSGHRRFKFEIFFFALFSLIAVIVLILGLAVPYMDHKYFYGFYSNSIGISFVLVVAALVMFPELLTDLAEIAKSSYSNSTLKELDIQQQAQKLQLLMQQSKLYQNENLNLGMVAEAMDLNAHQLSELVNRAFNLNFSRYVREQRVQAAMEILARQPDISILAISLEVGFGTQSNFYAAFKEITGKSPGAYRKSITR